MKAHLRIIGLMIILCLALTSTVDGAKKKDPWKSWLKEVEPIITHLELSTARMLQTEEERASFKKMFWKARDPIPQTPENEYQVDYYKRVYYAKHYLQGVRSDRGRIYMLLGPPKSKTSFTSDQMLVECVLWSYDIDDKPGLPPFMNLVFFKPRNTGDYQLYHPGIHRPRDLFSPSFSNRFRNQTQAFKEIRQFSPELARASLSIIPGEGHPSMSMALSSSTFALNRIFSLPEREAESGYIRNFRTPTGSVEVTHSTRAIRGFGSIALLRNKGLSFIHYSMMPDSMTWKQTAPNVFEAKVNLHVTIENKTGSLIFQNKRVIDLKVDQNRKQLIKKQRVVFRDFAPIIEGDYNIMLTFINTSTQDFFSYNQSIRVAGEVIGKANTVYGAVGFDSKELSAVDAENFIPFTHGKLQVLTDPRFTFSQKDALVGIVSAASQPAIRLESIGSTQENKQEIKRKNKQEDKKENKTVFTIDTLSEGENLFKFRLPLTEVKDGNYRLTVTGSNNETVVMVPKIHVLPHYIDSRKPFGMERPQRSSVLNNYLFILGQQYLTVKKPESAIKTFNKIPASLRRGNAVPIIARAYYLKGDYATVLQLLEPENVKKEYPILQMLANSAIDLKDYQRALKYLEQLRKYGDTVELNQLLASTHLSMGDRQKAKEFYERARKLKNKKE
jgi:GWxTD domain-containing protein